MVNEAGIRKGYKKTEVGVIPIDWEVKKLREIADVATGNTPPTNDSSNYGTDYLFVSPVDLGKGKYILNTEKKLSKKGFDISRRFPKYSVLFTCIGSTIGKSGIAPIELTSNQQINAVFPNSSFSSDFIFYCLNYLAPTIKSLASEQAVPIVNKTSFEATQLPHPPLPEQKAIANALSDMDSLITSFDNLIAKKRNIKQGAMQQLLTGKKRLPGFTGKWEEIRQRDECELITKGTTPTSFGKQFENDGINFIKIESIEENGNIIKDKVAFIDEDTHFLLKRSQLKENDVLISIAGALGRISVVKGNILPANINQAIALVRLKKQAKLSTEYLFYFLNSSTIKKNINLINVQAAQANLSLENINDFIILSPPLPEQKAIAEILSDMDNEIQSLEKKRSKYKAIKQGMMTELLTGKTRLI